MATTTATEQSKMTILGEKSCPPGHFNDWPNTQGFDVDYEERDPIELSVSGDIPHYASGVLFRTGLGPRTIACDNKAIFHVNHWFDNLAQIHRFQIDASKDGSAKVIYNSRLTVDGLIAKIKKSGKLDGYTFAAKYDPCRSFFNKLQAVFTPAEPAPNEVNIGVTISPNMPGLTPPNNTSSSTTSNPIQTLVQKTDASRYQLLSPETLEPIGLASQSQLHSSLTGQASAAHAKSCPKTGDIFNYNLTFSANPIYRVFRVSASTGKTSVLATVHAPAAYLHSLFLTENYVVLCVWNSYYMLGGSKILWTKNLLDAMWFESAKPAQWFVIDNRPPEQGGRGLIATYESDPFFCFHTINAFEVKNNSGAEEEVDIMCDLSAFNDMDVLHKFYYENLTSDSPKAKNWSDGKFKPTLRRYRLPSINSAASKKTGKAVLEYKSSTDICPELPTVDPRRITKSHRFVYGIMDTGKSTFADGLIKHDMRDHSVKVWSKHGHTAGEPIFIPDPEASEDEEDKGVCLSVVLDGVEGRSYLLVLDARTFEEVGRADVPGIVGLGFHGTFFGETRGVSV